VGLVTRPDNQIDGQDRVCPRADAKRIPWPGVNLDALERVAEGAPQRLETFSRAALVVTEPKAQHTQAVLRWFPDAREIGCVQPERGPLPNRNRCWQSRLATRASTAGDRSQHGWFHRHRKREPSGEAHPDRTDTTSSQEPSCAGHNEVKAPCDAGGYDCEVHSGQSDTHKASMD
jgi:hypothetical protein